MNKNELIGIVAEKAGLTKKDTERVVSATLETISAQLAAGERVQLSGFGIFEPRTRAPRVGRDPKCSTRVIEIPASRVPAFKASKALKDLVAK